MAAPVRDLSQLLDEARRAGARAAELFLTEESGIDATVVRGRVANQDPVETASLRVRVWADPTRMAEITGKPSAGPELVRRALAKAAKADEDPLCGPVGRLPMISRGLGIFDRRFEQLELSDRLEVVLSAERGARAVDRRVQASDFAYSDRVIRRLFASSVDVSVEELSTLYSVRGTVLVARNDAVVQLSDKLMGRSFSSVSSLPYGAVIARKAVEIIDARPVLLSGAVRVLLRPPVTAALFEHLSGAFSLADLRSGKSLFSAGYTSGQPVVHPSIHLLDDGGITGALRTRVFDEDGVPPVPLVLIKEGVVDGGFIDLRLSRELDAEPTGHRWPDGIRPSNLMLRSGTRSMSALLSEHSDTEVFVLDHVEGIEDINLTTGDFRIKAWGMVQKGQDVLGASLGVVLVGNILDVLSRVVDVASDTDRIGHIDAPGLLIDGMRVG